jgi:hypothetical protein
MIVQYGLVEELGVFEVIDDFQIEEINCSTFQIEKRLSKPRGDGKITTSKNNLKKFRKP